MLFIGPQLLSGIGQVTRRFATLAGPNAEYVVMGDAPKKMRYAKGFAFVLPIPDQLQMIEQYATLCDEMTYMTICETETVHPSYGVLGKYGTLLVASDFCKTVFERQFPDTTWKVLRLYASAPTEKVPRPFTSGPYVFYTIGNILDPRKNIKGLVDAFLRCGFGQDAHLVLKATCIKPVDWSVPGVTIINGLLSDEELEKVHDRGHCYVNCSHSEGVGMGAVEAALRSKPVVITDYGGLKEYVKTPWVIPCTIGPIGFDDFFFTKDLHWGHPSHSDLMRCMQECFQQKVTSWDHAHTKSLMDHVRSHFCYSMK